MLRAAGIAAGAVGAVDAVQAKHTVPLLSPMMTARRPRRRRRLATNEYGT